MTCAGGLVGPASITDAARLVSGAVVGTPVLDAAHWAGGELGLKLENLQPTGAFKIRSRSRVAV